MSLGGALALIISARAFRIRRDRGRCWQLPHEGRVVRGHHSFGALSFAGGIDFDRVWWCVHARRQKIDEHKILAFLGVGEVDLSDPHRAVDRIVTMDWNKHVEHDRCRIWSGLAVARLERRFLGAIGVDFDLPADQVLITEASTRLFSLNAGSRREEYPLPSGPCRHPALWRC
jgi:hypothetical protein